MFTGIIEQVGQLAAIAPRGEGARVSIRHAPWDVPLRAGDSVAVQGACLTVASSRADEFACDVLRETLARTGLGESGTGRHLNLERAMRADGRFGGHIVTGHVDGQGRVAELSPVGKDWKLGIGCGAELLQEIVTKGSITIDGVSLTVTAVSEAGFHVHLIPFTWEHTSLASLRPGASVNLETDILAKYMRRLMEGGAPAGGRGVSLDDLHRAGFG